MFPGGIQKPIFVADLQDEPWLTQTPPLPIDPNVVGPATFAPSSKFRVRVVVRSSEMLESTPVLKGPEVISRAVKRKGHFEGEHDVQELLQFVTLVRPSYPVTFLQA